MNETPLKYTVAPAPAGKEPSGWGKLWAAFGLGVLAWLVLVVVDVTGLLLGRTMEFDSNAVMAVAELCGGITAVLGVLALGGVRIMRPTLKGMGIAWVAALWLFATSGFLVLLEVVGIVLGSIELNLADDWPVRLFILALLCFGVALLEEASIRGLCLNGLLARMGRTRAGVYGAVIISSLVFGAIHCSPVDFGDAVQVGQNCMKVLQTGMCGFLFAAIVLKTKNLWTVVSIHAANDFLLLFLTNGLRGAAVSTDYVETGDGGATLLGFYVFMCLLYLPFILIGKRLIDEAAPWRGDFYHYAETSRSSYVAMPQPAYVAAPEPRYRAANPYVPHTPAASSAPSMAAPYPAQPAAYAPQARQAMQPAVPPSARPTMPPAVPPTAQPVVPSMVPPAAQPAVQPVVSPTPQPAAVPLQAHISHAPASLAADDGRLSPDMNGAQHDQRI